MRILSVVNQKGGCGKTTVSINLAAALAQRGKQVLLVDMDPQGHASLGLNVDPEDFERSMYDVLMHSSVEMDDILISVMQNLDLAWCSRRWSRSWRTSPGGRSVSWPSCRGCARATITSSSTARPASAC
jgi:hypothetical protein